MSDPPESLQMCSMVPVYPLLRHDSPYLMPHLPMTAKRDDQAWSVFTHTNLKSTNAPAQILPL